MYADRRPRGLSLALSTLSSGRIDGASRVLDAVGSSRGLVLDELAERSRWTAAAAPERAPLHASVAARQTRYATLMLRNVQGEAVPRALLDEARQQAEDAERELAEQSAVDRDDLERAKAGLNEVRQALPAGTALVSLVRYDRTRITTVNGRRVASVYALVLRAQCHFDRRDTSRRLSRNGRGHRVRRRGVAQRVPRSRNDYRPRRPGGIAPEVSRRRRATAATCVGPSGQPSFRRVQGLHRPRWRAHSGELPLAPHRQHALPRRDGPRSAPALDRARPSPELRGVVRSRSARRRRAKHDATPGIDRGVHWWKLTLVSAV